MAVGAVALRPLPMDATLGFEVRLAAEVLEVTVGVVTDQHDVSAATAVAAVGTTLGHVRLPTEAHATVAAATGLYVDSCSVFHWLSVSRPCAGVSKVMRCAEVRRAQA